MLRALRAALRATSPHSVLGAAASAGPRGAGVLLQAGRQADMLLGRVPGPGGLLPGYPGHPGYATGGPLRTLPVLKLRGLPFRCEEGDVVDFFSGLDVVDVLFVRKDKRLVGEAFVLFGNQVHFDLALQRNKMYMGRRYVEIFRARREEWYGAIANEVEEDGGVFRDDSQPAGAHGGGYGASAAAPGAYGGYSGGAGPSSRSLAGTVQAQIDAVNDPRHTGVVKLRGLPFSATVKDVMDFFAGFPISEDSIHIVSNSAGRNTGEAFVEFTSADDARHAMTRNHAHMGTRYIELYASSREEATSVAAKASAS